MRNKTLLQVRILGLAVALVLPVIGSAQTLERVKEAGVLNVGFVQDAAPFSSASADGQGTGYSIELCQRVAEAVKTKLGLPALQVKYKATSVSAGLANVGGDIDILCGSVTDTLARRADVSFSIPIYNGGIGALLSKKAPSDLVNVLKGKEAKPGPKWRATINRGLANHTYAVHGGTVTEDWVRERIATLGVIATIVVAEQHQAGVDMVEDGEADAYFADRAILFQFANDKKYSDLMVLDRYFTFEPIALAVARGDDDMRLVVDTVLSELYRSDDFKSIYERYFGAQSDVTQMLFKAFSRQ